MKENPLIILASGSASRKEQLLKLGFKFKVEVSGVDEDLFKTSPEKKEFLASVCQQIAQAKVEKVAKKYPSALVLAGDQMAVLGSKIYSKSKTKQQATETLRELQGKTHKLFTALSIRYKEKNFNYLEVNKMQMRHLTLDEIKRYVEIAHPLDCAGSYALERYGIGLFEKIETGDQNAVVGFPLIALINQLIKWNIAIPFLE